MLGVEIFIVMLSLIMLSVLCFIAILSVIMLSVVMQSVVMQSVVAPNLKSYLLFKFTLTSNLNIKLSLYQGILKGEVSLYH